MNWLELAREWGVLPTATLVFFAWRQRQFNVFVAERLYKLSYDFAMFRERPEQMADKQSNEEFTKGN